MSGVFIDDAGKPCQCPNCGSTAGEPETLDAAWAAVLDALPPGWVFDYLCAIDSHPDWTATAGTPAGAPEFGEPGYGEAVGKGPTPTAAVRALAAAMRGGAGR